MFEFVSGLICLWHGSIATIPPQFVLCDGNNGTPDLRDKFIVGAGSTYAVGAAGGSVNHNHDFTTDGHFHSFPAGTGFAAGAAYDDQTSSETDFGTTQNKDNLPPYYSLAYIMKT